MGTYSPNWWQCVELAQRLYNKMGWHSGLFGVSYAYQIYDEAPAMGMSRQPNGSISSIRPGDLVIHGSNEPYSEGAGHVTVVDYVEGSTVHVVEQNTADNDPTGEYTLSGGTLSRPGSGTIRGVVHDPANNFTGNDSSGSGSSDASRDFNGNGNDDILWYGAGAADDAMWFGSGSRDAGFLKTIGVDITGTYTDVLRGNFDGDEYGDILWYGAGAAHDHLWYGTDTKGVFTSASVTVNGDYTPVVGDFNGNGNDDILWYGAGSNPDAIWYGSGVRATGFVKTFDVTVSGTYTAAVSGNFDGDEEDDILWYGAGAAHDHMWYGTDTKGVFSSASVTVNGVYQPVAGDFNGNGNDDILWYGAGANADAIWYGSGVRATGFVKTFDVTVNGDYTAVVSGNFDGDEYGDDILWYGAGAANDGLWYGTDTKGVFTKLDVTVNGDYTLVR